MATGQTKIETESVHSILICVIFKNTTCGGHQIWLVFAQSHLSHYMHLKLLLTPEHIIVAHTQSKAHECTYVL